MKKILLTGGGGYIGTNIVSRYIFDYQFEICDYSKCLFLAHQLEQDYVNKFDAIIHLAALSGISACEEDPKRAIQENILTAGNIFKLASNKGIPVVFTSSQAVKDPKSSVYAFMKWSCEKLASLYNDKGGKNYIVRLSNVYGGDYYLEKKQTCVKQFIIKYRNSEPLEIHGNGKQQRDFIHVWDVCEAIMKLLETQPEEKDPIDIGTGKSISIMNLMMMFPRKENYHYKFVDNRNAGANSSIADVSVAKERIGFEATRKLEDYIKAMI